MDLVNTERQNVRPDEPWGDRLARKDLASLVRPDATLFEAS